MRQFSPVQRFVSLPENPIIYTVQRPFLALDTMTGKLCRPWDFRCENPTDFQKDLQNLDTCVDLYKTVNGEIK